MVKNKKLKNKKLKVPRHVQLAGKFSGSCILSSAQQVMDYKDYYKSIEEIVEESNCDEGGDASDSECGRYALKQGFSVTINTYDCNNFDPSWFKLRRRSLMRKLKKIMKYKERKFKVTSGEAEFYRSYWNFLKEGGKIKFRPPTKEYIEECIDNDAPLIASVYYELLYKEPRSFRRFSDSDIFGEPTPHAVVISGYKEIEVRGNKETELHITDPDGENPILKSGRYWYNADEFIANCNQAGGTTILIKP